MGGSPASVKTQEPISPQSCPASLVHRTVALANFERKFARRGHLHALTEAGHGVRGPLKIPFKKWVSRGGIP
jgi:hypothetical protein